ncbi:signal peptidase I [Nocardioides panacis]|uniref:Signal peptidase I n=1 Tax=Nocardioides panacis TaxID=2849501 RepID=A0A975T0N0_9ACTN|nr:signal peptidase I [Nocardioides panacis]QWZ09448.1 signal peptidase I [Nocardioides panacis]
MRPLLVALPVVLLLLTGRFVAEPFEVASSSMTPTLRDGDEVLGEKLWPHLRGLRRDDLVVFHPPGTDALMVKRVVGLAGDTVALADGRLVVDGRPVPEAYVDLPSVDGVYYGPVTVPAGSVFVLGDDRASSVDSRSFGPVPRDRVVGRVLTRLW